MTTTTEPQFLSLPIEWVIPHPNNVRRDLGDLTSLAESIATDGILEPLIVTPSTAELAAKSGAGSGVYLLLAGHRRLAAAMQAGVLDVPCIVRADLSSLPDQIVAMLNENDHRADLNAVEQADAYQTLLDLDLDETAIATRIGRPKRHVRDRLKLRKCSDEIREKIARGDVTLDVALTIQSYAKHPDLAQKLEESAGTDRWAHELIAAEREKSRRDKQAKLIREYKARGITVVAHSTTSRNDYRLAKARELQRDLLVEYAGRTEPDDAATSDGMVFGQFEPYSTHILWHRLVDEDITVDDVTPGGPKPTAGLSEAETIARLAALEAEQAKLTEDLAVAATLRRRHLSDTLFDSDTAVDVAHHIVMGQLSEQLEDFERIDFEMLADLIGVTLPSDDNQEANILDAWTRAVLDAAHGKSVAQIVTLAHIAYRCRAEYHLADPKAWEPAAASSYKYSGARTWRKELGEWFGYEWTDTEATLIDTTETALNTATEN